MKASKLVEELQEMIKEHGDCDVVYVDEIEGAVFSSEGIQVFSEGETKQFYIR